MTKNKVGDISIGGLLGDFRLLLILFTAFRLLMLLVYQPLIVDGLERGLTAGGDFMTYFNLASFSGAGLLPFRDWWSEFPPIPSFLLTSVYGLLGPTPRYETFAVLLGLILLGFEMGNLVLVRAIGSKLHGSATGTALAWIYALFLAPSIFIWWNFEAMVAFCLLLSLHWLLDRRFTRSALAAGVGALVKFTPALLIGAVWRFEQRRTALRWSIIVLAIFGLIYGLLFLQNAAMTIPSLTAQFSKSSYQTVWALLDGNYTTGNFGPLSDRLDPALAAVPLGNPSVVPSIIRLGVAAALGLAIYLRVKRFDPRGMVAFVAITLLIFFLQAQGWSTQWLAQIIPLLLLALPNRNTVLALVLLSATAFAEYPFLFLRTGETNGVISGDLITPFVILIAARTLILVAFCAALYQKLRQEPVPDV